MLELVRILAREEPINPDPPIIVIIFNLKNKIVQDCLISIQTGFFNI